MSKEAKIGIFTLITIAVLIAGFYYLKARNVFQRNVIYYAVYDKVEGLYESDQVTINGFPIGAVEKISLMDNNLGKIILKLEVKGDIKIPKNSVALIYSSDLLGEKAIKILLGDSPKLLAENDTISSEISPSIIEKFGDEVVPLTTKAGNMIGKLDTTVSGVNRLFDKNDSANIYAVINNLTATTANLVDISAALKSQLATNGELDQSLKHINSITGNLEKQNEHINSILKNIEDITDTVKDAGLKSTVADLHHTVNSIDSLILAINNDNGTTGKLIHDQALYTKLSDATTNLNKLLETFNADPEFKIRLSLFGKKDKKPADNQTNDMDKESPAAPPPPLH